MVRTPTKETPFLLAFRTKAVVPVKIGMTIYRTPSFDSEKNDEYLRNNLDMLEGKKRRGHTLSSSLKTQNG